MDLLSRVPSEFVTRVADLLYKAQYDPHAEVELRLGKLDSKGRFRTDIGKRTAQKIEAELRTSPHWVSIDEIHVEDSFFEDEPSRRLSYNHMTKAFQCIDKVVRDRVDIPMPWLPFDIRVTWASEVPADIPKTDITYNRDKLRTRFNDRNLFAYDVTHVTTGTHHPSYEFELELLRASKYVQSRGPHTAAESIIVKGLDLVRFFVCEDRKSVV